MIFFVFFSKDRVRKINLLKITYKMLTAHCVVNVFKYQCLESPFCIYPDYVVSWFRFLFSFYNFGTHLKFRQLFALCGGFSCCLAAITLFFFEVDKFADHFNEHQFVWFGVLIFINDTPLHKIVTGIEIKKEIRTLVPIWNFVNLSSLLLLLTPTITHFSTAFLKNFLEEVCDFREGWWIDRPFQRASIVWFCILCS